MYMNGSSDRFRSIPGFNVDLTEDEIECRVQSVKQNGLVLLLYKNARCDMNILDETVGAENWQREHYECKGNLFCRVGVVKFVIEYSFHLRSPPFGLDFDLLYSIKLQKKSFLK